MKMATVPVFQPPWHTRMTGIVFTTEFSMKAFITLPAVLLLGVTATGAQARPPQAAFDACENRAAGDSCRMNTPQGRLQGRCEMPPRDNRLVCKPAGARPGGKLHGGFSDHQQGQAQGGERRQPRQHTVVQSDGDLNLIVADTAPVAANRISVTVSGETRILTANGISDHPTGAFPNRGNPHSIETQNYRFRIPAYPEVNGWVTPLTLGDFGISVNGVPFDPGAAEWYRGDRDSGWQYEALSGAVTLGLDENHAHVQPSGAYHYHGLPSLLLEGLNVQAGEHSPQIGWAADGFPIYALYGDADDTSAAVRELMSGYRVKAGHRPSGGSNPGGHYDGTFTADYEYVEGLGDLDECNGRVVVTPDYPQGIYAYFLTNSWPVIPRCFKGTPSADFTRGRR